MALDEHGQRGSRWRLAAFVLLVFIGLACIYGGSRPVQEFVHRRWAETIGVFCILTAVLLILLPAALSPDGGQPRYRSWFSNEDVTLISLITSPHRTFIALISVCLILCVAIAVLGVGINYVSTNFASSEIKVNAQGVLTLLIRGQESSVVALSPTGGEDSPWMDTGIDVKEGDSVRITATGRVCTSLPHMINAMSDNTKPIQPWVGPDGFTDLVASKYGRRPVDRIRRRHFLAPQCPEGALLCRIATETPVAAPMKPNAAQDYYLYKGHPLEVRPTKAGRIWLAVNDVWLDKDRVEAYVPEMNSADLIGYYAEKGAQRNSNQTEKMLSRISALCRPLPREGQIDGRNRRWLVVELRRMANKAGYLRQFINENAIDKKKLEAALVNLAKVGKLSKEQDWAENVQPANDESAHPNLYFEDNSGQFIVTIERR